MADIGNCFPCFHYKIKVRRRKTLYIKHLLAHNITFKIVKQRIAFNAALTADNIDICHYNVFQQAGKGIKFHFLTALKQFVDFSCFF